MNIVCLPVYHFLNGAGYLHIFFSYAFTHIEENIICHTLVIAWFVIGKFYPYQ